ncbi:MAG: sugar ABC transporter permease [Anaerolineaceae bacterium]|nr:sugar ABC transporter permease [Anaerolineaceae bacterium]MDD9954744.1 sugar ABC transporter permease [Anaerolineaceae bacterium]MDE0328288.1 sugar ABC transporter permease [Anaerolineaceae bacterium]MDE0608929.1 sugar ABC transporter permease [Anaerolineaceae bacterium]
MTLQAQVQSGSSAEPEQSFTDGRISARWFPVFMLLPAILFILVVLLFPLIYSLYVSFTPYELLKPNSLKFELARALRNYQRLFADAIFWKSVGNTIVFLFLSINLSYVIALGLSQLLARVTRGQGLMRTLLMVPMMFAPILVGFQFRWFFNANVGLVNNLLFSLGLMQERGQIAWLVDEPLGMFSIIVASIWMNLPVLTIILLAGTLSLPVETFEAADVDGANSWQQFRFITFPLLAPFSYIALTILSLDISRAFDIVRIMTDGGPAHRTELIWTYVTRLAIENTKFGLGSAMSWVTVVLAVAFTLYFFRQLVRSRVVR